MALPFGIKYVLVAYHACFRRLLGGTLEKRELQTFYCVFRVNKSLGKRTALKPDVSGNGYIKHISKRYNIYSLTASTSVGSNPITRRHQQHLGSKPSNYFMKLQVTKHFSPQCHKMCRNITQALQPNEQQLSTFKMQELYLSK